MRLKVLVLILALVGLGIQEQGAGEKRLRKLKQRQKGSSGIITFSTDDFNEYCMQYPRPYHVVIYFTGSSCKLCEQGMKLFREMMVQYEYMATLFNQQESMSKKNPVFFAVITYNRESHTFGFKSVPNLAVSRPEMPLISQIQKKQYLQKYKWSISFTDGDVTTHKMLDFVNPRTECNVFYRPTLTTMIAMFFLFILVTVVGVVIYTQLQFLWTHWVVWFIGVILIYITCISGVVFDIIHNVPFIGRDQKTGQPLIFSDGTRQQFGAEGLVISLTISGIGLLLTSVVVVAKKVSDRKMVRVWGVIALMLIVGLAMSLEALYKTKSWYGPSFFPPSDYSHGSIATDQGNNI